MMRHAPTLVLNLANGKGTCTPASMARLALSCSHTTGTLFRLWRHLCLTLLVAFL